MTIKHRCLPPPCGSGPRSNSGRWANFRGGCKIACSGWGKIPLVDGGERLHRNAGSGLRGQKEENGEFMDTNEKDAIKSMSAPPPPGKWWIYEKWEIMNFTKSSSTRSHRMDSVLLWGNTIWGLLGGTRIEEGFGGKA